MFRHDTSRSVVIGGASLTRNFPAHTGNFLVERNSKEELNMAVLSGTQVTYADLAGMDDNQLMMSLKDGHNDALAVLFDRYHRVVFSIAFRIVRDRREAEDVLQTVFLDIFRSVMRFDTTKETARVWLVQYAYHYAISRKEDLRAHQFCGQRNLRDDTAMLSTNSWFTLYTQYQLKQLVEEGLAKLSERQQRIIELASYTGLSMKGIADQLGESLVSVRRHYYCGLQKLRSFLEEKSAKKTK
jgi:RNA polymerase sigma-70 factor, ECF subfamily